MKKLKKLKKLRKPRKRKTGITWSAIRKANKKRLPSSLELKVYKLLDGAGITYKKEKCIGRCHADIFIEPNLVAEIQGCFFHSCEKCFPKPLLRQKKALVKDMKRFIFFRSKGFVVLEVWEHEVKKDPDKVLKKILTFIEENK